jgi:protein-S-isoprenylcysteine O-methyltransferase Ste14
MSKVRGQGLPTSPGMFYGGQAKGSRRKSPVERRRRWLQVVWWTAFFTTILMMKPSVDNKGVQQVITIVAWALVTAATVGRLWCSLYLRGRKSKSLCQAGPYSLCRNPLYVFAFLGGMGIAVAPDRAVLMILFPFLFWGCYLPVIRAEERRLSELFGGEYEAYCARVPRIIPRFKNYSTCETVTVTVDHYLRGIVKSMGYFWMILAVQLVETLRSSSSWLH